MEAPGVGVDAKVQITRKSAIKDKGAMGSASRPAAASIGGEAALFVPDVPPLSGLYLRLALAVAESRFGEQAFQAVSAFRLAPFFDALRAESFPEAPRPAGLHSSSWGAPVDEEVVDSASPDERLVAALHSLDHAGATKCSTASNVRPTVLDYHYAYTHGMVTPAVVAERVIKFLETHNSQQRWLSAWSADEIRAQAAASTERYAAGHPLSVMDGVPFVVKDCIDALPYATGYGTTFMGELRPATADAPCVAALKHLGAMLLGKGAMPEFGVLPHGLNAHDGSTLNPHNPGKLAGGSSSGCAAAVAVGLCPIAIGSDGGGSIRIPSSLCGVVGLKTTKGRLADDHGAHGAYSSLVVSGPLANSVADLTLLYAVMANADYPAASRAASELAPASAALPGAAGAAAATAAAGPRPLGLPHVLLPLPEEAEHSAEQQGVAELKPLAGLRVGVVAEWTKGCSPAIADVLKAALNRLLLLGATKVDISLPELNLVQSAHGATFAREMLANAADAGWLNDWSLRSQLNLDTRMFYANASAFTDADYLQAQRIRARALTHFERAFQACDLILTPTMTATAPPMPADADTTGVYDLATTLQLIRNFQAANLTGLPALVMPAGRENSNGMPVAVQLVGKPWAESTLLRGAAALEQQLLEEALPHPLPHHPLLNPIECPKGAHPLAAAMTRKLWSKRYGRSAK